MRETRRDVHERAPLSSPSPRAELGYTRVEPIIERPKSETSDFGWGEGRGEGALHAPCPWKAPLTPTLSPQPAKRPEKRGEGEERAGRRWPT